MQGGAAGMFVLEDHFAGGVMGDGIDRGSRPVGQTI